MKLHWCSLLIIISAGPGFAQEPAPINTGIPAKVIEESPPVVFDADPVDTKGGLLKGDKEFSNFIGFSSNPVFNVDPRSLTQLMPIYQYTSTNAVKPVPGMDLNVFGPLLSIAITDRLNVGFTDGGYVWTQFNKNQTGPLGLGGNLFNRDRAGWLDIGGYAQYTVIRDVPNQFLATAGLGWKANTGSSSLFQGSPPWNLNPYVTVGKEFGEFHILANAGYNFPAGSGDTTTEIFYGSVHLDRRCFGFIYPLVEFNWAVHSTSVNLSIPTREGIIELGDLSANGNLVTVNPGINAVLVQDKVELGVVYGTPIYAQHDFHFNTVLVKLVLRF